jgi:hypothetical protein
MRKTVFMIAALIAATAAFAQVPLQDGTIKAGEYAFTEVKNGITIAASLSSDGKTIYMAVSAATKGWIALGAGSAKMNGSYMILAYQDDKGERFVSEETGVGYTHKPNAKNVAKAFVNEADGVTTLEAQFPAEAMVKDGKLDAIAAFGARDDRTSMHRGRAVYSISLK